MRIIFSACHHQHEAGGDEAEGWNPGHETLLLLRPVVTLEPEPSQDDGARAADDGSETLLDPDDVGHRRNPTERGDVRDH